MSDTSLLSLLKEQVQLLDKPEQRVVQEFAQAEKEFKALLLDLIEIRLRLDNAFTYTQLRKKIF